MQRIPTLIQKITELSQKGEPHVIEIDLMLDYTRVLYADLLELRNRAVFNSSIDEPADNAATQALPPAEEVIENGEQESGPEIQPEPEPVSLNHVVDIRSFIAINDKYQFISELFSNDKEAYDDVLDNLNRFEQQTEAEGWLVTEVAEKYKWRDDNLTVQMFYGTVSQFFSFT